LLLLSTVLLLPFRASGLLGRSLVAGSHYLISACTPMSRGKPYHQAILLRFDFYLHTIYHREKSLSIPFIKIFDKPFSICYFIIEERMKHGK